MISQEHVSAGQLSVAFERLSCEASDFRRRVLPRLISFEHPDAVKWSCTAELLCGHASYLARYCLGRSLIVDSHETRPICELQHEVDNAMGAVRSTLHPTAQHHLLRPESEPASATMDAEERLPRWSLYCMLYPWDAQTLGERVGTLAEDAGIFAKSATEMRQKLRTESPRLLVRRFRNFDLNKFIVHAETLLRVAPFVTDQVFRVFRSSRVGPPAQAMPPESPMVTGITSYLLSSLCEARANNHFGLVCRVVCCADIHGSWSIFTPGRILDILYQKWRYLSGVASEQIV